LAHASTSDILLQSNFTFQAFHFRIENLILENTFSKNKKNPKYIYVFWKSNSRIGEIGPRMKGWLNGKN